MKKVKSIDALGYVKFIGEKGLETNGTQADCEAIGGVFTENGCLLPLKTGKARVAKNINATGRKNEIHGSNGFVLGHNNKVEEDHTIALGNAGSAIRFGEFVHASSDSLARSQRSVLMFQGRTTDEAWNEIYLGGVDGKRFIVDESKECLIGFEAYVLGYRVDASGLGQCMNRFQHATFNVSANRLNQIGSTGTKTNNKNHANSWTNRFTATSATPDYIKAEVQGVSGATIDWTIILYVSELRTDAI